MKKDKDIKYYMSLKYPVTMEVETEQGVEYYSLEIPDLPGCHAYGKTVDEALKRLDEAKREWFRVSLKKGFEIPEPEDYQFSGKLLLRIPPKLHAQLAKEAKKQNISLNRHIQTILEQDINVQMLQQKINDLVNKVNNIEDLVKSLKTVRQGGTASRSGQLLLEKRGEALKTAAESHPALGLGTKPNTSESGIPVLH